MDVIDTAMDVQIVAMDVPSLVMDVLATTMDVFRRAIDVKFHVHKPTATSIRFCSRAKRFWFETLQSCTRVGLCRWTSIGE
jgi:hypothetical protein